jgi:hypothetical protein
MLVNCTPHYVKILSSKNVTYNAETKEYTLTGEPEVLKEYKPSGIITRCNKNEEKIGRIDGIEIFRTIYSEPWQLPEKKRRTYYIVSALVANAAKDRDDLFVPAHQVRDGNGVIVGCLALSKV